MACDQALQMALKDLNGPGEIFFPAGTYLFKQTIHLPDSILLRGEMDSSSLKPLSILMLAPGNNRHGISITGGQALVIDKIHYELKQGSQKLAVRSPSSFIPGDIIKLNPTDDSTLVNNTWAFESTGQIFEILKIEGDSLILNKPLRRSYSGTHAPLLKKLNPIRQVHLQCLGIFRIDTTTSQSSNIYFNNAMDCSVSGVQSYFCNFAHIDINNSSRISIINSHYKDAHSYGGGGKGYGVMIQSGSGDCYIHQNYFDHLRHSMILQAGANGNVIAYNYSSHPYWTETILPSNSAGDLVLHGNYVYMNLFEGNVVQNIVIDNSHGINGPFNTFYRNRAELFGIFMNAQPASHSQNFIANQVINTNSAFLGLYSLQGNQHYEYGNIVKGNIMPNTSTDPNTVSLFNYEFSSFYMSKSSIPPVRHDNWNSNVPSIEVNYRARITNQKSICENLNYSITNVKTKLSKKFIIFPTSFSNELHLLVPEEISGKKIFIYDLTGRLLYFFQLNQNNLKIDTGQWKPGMYLIKIPAYPDAIFKMIKTH
jgi:hypothetical protein